MSTIDDEIVRLLQEISKDEKELVRAQATADSCTSEYLKREYASKARILKESMDRKMEIIKTLKGKA